MNASYKRIIRDALVKELQNLESEIERNTYFIQAMWPFCKGKDTETTDNFKLFNKYKSQNRAAKSRKTKVQSSLRLIKYMQSL